MFFHRIYKDIQYLQRVYKRDKDPLSKSFRDLYREKENRARLDEDILELWKNHHPELKGVIGDFKGALKLRHWLAHGRYWLPRLGRLYDAYSVYIISDNIMNNFDLRYS